MRTVSADFRNALFDEATGEVIVLLLTFTHPALPNGEMRLSTDNADLLNYEEQLRGTISRGRQYSFMPCEISLPEDGDDVQATLQATFFDVAMEITPLLEQATAPIYVTAEIVLASTPDLVEVEFAAFELASADIQGDNVVLSLTVDAMASEPYPADNFTPSSFPGLWSQF